MRSGKLVKLKGGNSPTMTVRWMREATMNQQTVITGVVCEWFDINFHLQQHEFKLESLEEV